MIKNPAGGGGAGRWGLVLYLSNARLRQLVEVGGKQIQNLHNCIGLDAIIQLTDLDLKPVTRPTLNVKSVRGLPMICYVIGSDYVYFCHYLKDAKQRCRNLISFWLKNRLS